MVSLLLGFCLGVFLAPWVREPLAGLVARGVRAIGGVRPVADNKPIEPATDFGREPRFVTETATAGIDFTPKRPKVTVLGAAKNIAAFAGGVLAWCLRNPLLALIAIVAALWAVWMLLGSPLPFGLGKSRDLVNYEARLAEQRAEIADKFGDARTEIVSEFERAVSRIDRDLAEGVDELENLRHAEDLVFLSHWAATDRRLRDSGAAG